jgi:Tfp pilus assembly pilus retraction ATPase PilT
MLYEVMTRRAMSQLEQKDGADFAYTIPGVSRFRCNVFRHIGGLGGVFRAIPSKALTLDQLNLPPPCAASAGDQRPDPRDGQDRLGQIDDARGDDRRHQPAR